MIASIQCSLDADSSNFPSKSQLFAASLIAFLTREDRLTSNADPKLKYCKKHKIKQYMDKYQLSTDEVLTIKRMTAYRVIDILDKR